MKFDGYMKFLLTLFIIWLFIALFKFSNSNSVYAKGSAPISFNAVAVTQGISNEWRTIFFFGDEGITCATLSNVGNLTITGYVSYNGKTPPISGLGRLF